MTPTSAITEAMSFQLGDSVIERLGVDDFERTIIAVDGNRCQVDGTGRWYHRLTGAAETKDAELYRAIRFGYEGAIQERIGDAITHWYHRPVR